MYTFSLTKSILLSCMRNVRGGGGEGKMKQGGTGEGDKP